MKAAQKTMIQVEKVLGMVRVMTGNTGIQI